ncbi:sensor histidine kinase [Acidovorax sp. CCYZU-2555]|uniref:sensor histidine kinase n=1 Tax=Acidovorax sp. CCYZU-2555 TaxID=2835042 RepID=UPI001BCCA8DF|nr:sensor histidine kinase [Acidovorax sp. CCYZU-2555]MBS7778310.1 sensor histidine kinase [Acidovorax sp. CCYZU-2555]
MASARAPLRPAWSLRRQLLVGILLPVLLLIGFNTWSLHQQTLTALNTAYDRTLLASAKSISEQLGVFGYDDEAELRALVPYSALEIFEADNQSRMFYRVSTINGEMVSGFAELPMWRGQIPQRPPYAALVDFYDAQFRGVPVRMAVLLQPVASAEGRGMAVIQVAETLELREAQAWPILWRTLASQALLVAVIALIVVLVVQRATQPVRALSAALQARTQGDLSPLHAPTAARELQPLVQATNQVMQRLRLLLAHQKRFVRDASHQLRTPLAVLKIQVQSAQRGDVPAAQAFAEIGATVERATQLANQMLSLAKVEQLRQQDTPAPPRAWDDIVREIALDLSPLMAEKNLDFELQAPQPVDVDAHAWMLRELTRNLLHNAVHYSPASGWLRVQLTLQPAPNGHCAARLCISDSGPGISDELAQRLFQPFSAGDLQAGSGLGLAICHEIVQALGGQLQLRNRSATPGGIPAGLDAVVTLRRSDTLSHDTRMGTSAPRP